MYSLSVHGLEQEDRKRRKRQCKRIGAAVPRHRLRLDASRVADPASRVFSGVGIQNLAMVAAERNAYAVIPMHHGGEIAHRRNIVVSISRAAKIGDNAVLDIVAIDPFEALGLAVAAVQLRRARIQPVQVAVVVFDRCSVGSALVDSDLRRRSVELARNVAGL
jgi:hypothetical protein